MLFFSEKSLQVYRLQNRIKNYSIMGNENSHDEMTQIIQIVQKFYLLNVVSTSDLGGHSGDKNLLIQTKNKKKYVLKISNCRVSYQHLRQQKQVTEYLQKKHQGIQYPALIPAQNGQHILKEKIHKKDHYFRLSKYIQGSTLESMPKCSKQFLRHFGRMVGQMTSFLRYYPKTVSNDRLISYSLESVRHYIEGHQNPTLEYFIQNYQMLTKTILSKSSRMVIHGNIHPGNMIVDPKSQKIVGFIGFGTCGMSHDAYDLGTIICHLIDQNKCSFEDATQFLIGFYQISGLTEEQLNMMYYFIGARVLFINKHFGMKNMMQRLFVENGPKYTQKIFKDAVDDWLAV